MKKILLIMMMLMPLAVAGQGSLYGRYAPREDLTVAQVEGFRLNDTVKVDVLILVADDAAAWDRLREEFGIRTTEGVTSWLGEADNPSRRTRWIGQLCCKVIASHSRRTLCIYRLRSHTEYDALLDYQLEKLKIDN